MRGIDGKSLASNNVVKRGANGLTCDEIHSVVVKSTTHSHMIFRLDGVTEEETEKVKEFHLHVELEVSGCLTHLLKTKAIFRLK